MVRLALILLTVLAAACGESHSAGDAGADAGRRDAGGRSDAGPRGCDEPAPDPCGIERLEPRCCSLVTPECVDGVWNCQGPDRCDRYGGCGMPGCDGPPPECRRLDASGCCDLILSPTCDGRGWSCPPGSIEAERCECLGGECAGLGEVACLQQPECAPLYDDLCCPTCVPGGCADCIRIDMWSCAPVDAACGGDPGLCGQVAEWSCGEAPDCREARPTGLERCDRPGCVVAVDAGCDLDACERYCVPVTGDSCRVACRVPAPACSEGTFPEGDGSCYTGRCIPVSVCAP